MDIASLSSSISSQNIQNDIQIAVLSKSLDADSKAGDEMVKMMESSVSPNIGQHIDYKV